jgi:SAM-dependent methyltransferase
MDLKHLQRNWDDLGRTDPLWAVLTWPGKRGKRWDPQDFFAIGRREIEALIRYMDSLPIDVQRRKALDFGCGVGRLTQPLAEHFDEVWGVDIAPSMIELAGRYNRHGDRCQYRVNDSDDLQLFADETFDFVFSHLTLQHMDPRLAKGYIRDFLRVLVPGGLLIFQMAGEPTATRRGPARALRRLVRRLIPDRLMTAGRKLRYGHLIDMYGTKREDVLRFLDDNGARVVDVREDTSAGGGWTSFRYCAAKD